MWLHSPVIATNMAAEFMAFNTVWQYPSALIVPAGKGRQAGTRKTVILFLAGEGDHAALAT